MRSVLTVAASDSSGGAGIQADIKTIEANLLFAQSAITALTAQNTTGVYGVEDMSPDFVEKQIDVVFDDIRPDAVKIGMVSSSDIAHAVASALMRNGAKNIVVDPVMVATSGAALIRDATVEVLVDALLPIARVVTPNIPEAERLSGMPITCEDDMAQAARAIAERISGAARPGACGHVAVLVKGGHSIGAPASANDFLLNENGDEVWLGRERVDNPNAHGTGCTLSSAIACGLAKGLGVEQSCRLAKDYVTGALQYGLNLGKGSGPLNHMWEYM